VREVFRSEKPSVLRLALKPTSRLSVGQKTNSRKHPPGIGLSPKSLQKSAGPWDRDEFGEGTEGFVWASRPAASIFTLRDLWAAPLPSVPKVYKTVYSRSVYKNQKKEALRNSLLRKALRSRGNKI